MTITAWARAKAGAARKAMADSTPRTTFKGCDGTNLKVGDRVRGARFKTLGTVVSINVQELPNPPAGCTVTYTEIGVHYGPVKPEHLTATEADAWFIDDELQPAVPAVCQARIDESGGSVPE